MLLSYYLAATRAYCRLFWVLYWFWNDTNINPYNILHLIVNKKMDMVALLFKWMLLMIRFFIFRKKVPLLLCQDCINVTIMGKVLNFMFKKSSCCIMHPLKNRWKWWQPPLPSACRTSRSNGGDPNQAPDNDGSSIQTLFYLIHLVRLSHPASSNAIYPILPDRA